MFSLNKIYCFFYPYCKKIRKLAKNGKTFKIICNSSTQRYVSSNVFFCVYSLKKISPCWIHCFDTWHFHQAFHYVHFPTAPNFLLMTSLFHRGYVRIWKIISYCRILRLFSNALLLEALLQVMVDGGLEEGRLSHSPDLVPNCWLCNFRHVT